MKQIMDGKNIDENLLNYFNKSNTRCLEVLDNKYRNYYTGVTVNYLTYNLLKGKYRKSDVSKSLLMLHKEGQIKSLFCPDIKKYVFESRKSNHGGFSSETGGYDGYASSQKEKNVHTYLETFIKN